MIVIKALFLFIVSMPAFAFTIASGHPSGVYFQVASEICANYKCKVRQTAGSSENVKLLLNGSVEAGLVQGNVPELDGFYSMPLYKEYMFLITAPHFHINSVQDLNGKTGGINKKSGHGEAFNILVNTFNLQNINLKEEMFFAKRVQDLCTGKIDFVLLFISEQSQALRDMLAICNLNLYSFSYNEIEKLERASPNLHMDGVLNARTVGADVKLYSRNFKINLDNPTKM